MSYYGRPVPPHGGPSPGYMAGVLGIKRVKSTMPSSSQPVKKRKVSNSSPRPSEVIAIDDDDEEDDDEVAAAAAQSALAGIGAGDTPKRTRKKKGEAPEEKRLKRFRKAPPQSYSERLYRVRTQRMFLIERNRSWSEDGTHEEEIFDIAGSTGNIYQVTITKVPHCSCPDSQKGNHCKHIVYVMVNVLKARDDLAYQVALLTTELAEIFGKAPVTQKRISDDSSTGTGGTRKPIDGDCPVCVMEFEAGEDLVWCKAACGQNVHRRCFEQWQRSKPGQPTKCVFCRSIWQSEESDMKKVSKTGQVNSEGYVNVAGELGISQHRDTSSYHAYWVNSQRYAGGDPGSSRWRRR